MKNMQIKRIAVIGFIAFALLVAGGRMLAAMQPENTQDLLQNALDALDSPHQPCKPVGLQSMMSMDGLLPCATEPAISPVAHLVGNLCVSFEWFCTEGPWSNWMASFLQNKNQVSDIILDDDVMTFLGERDDISWRVQMLIDKLEALDPQQTKILFSTLQAAQKQMRDDAMTQQQIDHALMEHEETLLRIFENKKPNPASSTAKPTELEVRKPVLERFKPKPGHGPGVVEMSSGRAISR